MKLPAPCPTFGHYTLEDGSRVYPSGSEDCPVRPGKWFVWFRGPTVPDEKTGRVTTTGRILLDTNGIRYFASPREAMQEVSALRRLIRQGKITDGFPV